MTLNLDEFETVIIHKLFTDTTYATSILGYINHTLFQNNHNKEIVKIYCDFFEKYNNAPNLTEIKQYLSTVEIVNALKQCIIKSKEVQEVDEKWLYDNTERFIKERSIYNTLIATASDISKGVICTDKILQDFEKSCLININPDNGTDIVKDIDKIVTELQSKNATISSGWPWLDECLNGGFLEAGRAMYVFAGEVNIGKSIILGNLAANISKQGKTALLISLEMSEIMYAKRLCSGITGIPINSIEQQTDILKHKVLGNVKVGQNIIIKEFPPSTITVKQLQSFITRFIQSHSKPDVIIIDYLTLIHSAIGNNSYERGKYVSEQLRALSYIFKCPIITAVQLRREAFSTDSPDMTAIGESIAIAQTADFICSIFQTEAEKELGLIKFGLMKNRFNRNYGSCSMKIDYETLTASQVEDNIDEPDPTLQKIGDIISKYTKDS